VTVVMRGTLQGAGFIHRRKRRTRLSPPFSHCLREPQGAQAADAHARNESETLFLLTQHFVRYVVFMSGDAPGFARRGIESAEICEVPVGERNWLRLAAGATC
jgi:hypothetical protein